MVTSMAITVGMDMEVQRARGNGAGALTRMKRCLHQGMELGVEVEAGERKRRRARTELLWAI
jgi:hypothetical protein